MWHFSAVRCAEREPCLQNIYSSKVICVRRVGAALVIVMLHVGLKSEKSRLLCKRRGIARTDVSAEDAVRAFPHAK